MKPYLRWHFCEIGAYAGRFMSKSDLATMTEDELNTAMRVQVGIEIQLVMLNLYSVRDYAADAGGSVPIENWRDLPLATEENLFLQPPEG